MIETLYTVLDNPEAMERLRKAGYSPESVRSLITDHRQKIATAPTDFTYHPRETRDEKDTSRVRVKILKRPVASESVTAVEFSRSRVTRANANPYKVVVMPSYGRIPEKSEAIKARQMKSIYGTIVRRLKAQHATAPVLDKATMELLHHRVRLIQPNLDAQGIQDLLAKLIEQGRLDLGKKGLRSRKFFLKAFSRRNETGRKVKGTPESLSKQDFQE